MINGVAKSPSWRASCDFRAGMLKMTVGDCSCCWLSTGGNAITEVKFSQWFPLKEWSADSD